MPFSLTPPAPCQWFSYLAAALDRRSAVRLALLFGDDEHGDKDQDRHAGIHDYLQ
jgi:hypothetical protein